MLDMPVEKLRLRPWLESTLNSGRIPGVTWVERGDKIFKVSWKHASRHGWNLDKDACIFKEWAVHTGRFRDGLDKPDPRRWKANFRCALNALPDIKELQARGVTRGNNAFKVYQMVQRIAVKKEALKNSKAAQHSNSNRKTPKHKSASTGTTHEVVKRRSVIQKSSKMREPESSYSIATSHPINKQHSYFTFWPTFPTIAHAHLKDHDYLTTWYDPRPEMKDIGVMTYQMEGIKEEPQSPHEKETCCREYDQNLEAGMTEAVYMTTVKEEKAVPSDEEIIDLVDRMSRDSDSLSHRSDSTSSFDEFEAIAEQESPVSSPQRPSSLPLNLKEDQSAEYGMGFGFSERAPPPPLTPDSTRDILKGITTPASQG